MNRLQRFIYRLKNQYRIHHSHLSIWEIIKIAYKESNMKKPKIEKVKISKLEDLNF